MKRNNKSRYSNRQPQTYNTNRRYGEKRQPVYRKPKTQAYVLLHDRQGNLLIGENAIVSKLLCRVDFDNAITNPVTKNDLQHREKMQYARKCPKQKTFIGGAANANDPRTSALRQMKQEIGLILYEEEILGFDGVKICDVMNERIKYFDNKGNELTGYDDQQRYQYCILFIELEGVKKLQDVTDHANDNLAKGHTHDQELGAVEVIKVSEIEEKLLSVNPLTQPEIEEWSAAAKYPIAAKGETFYPRNDRKIQNELSYQGLRSAKDWFVKGIEALEKEMKLETSNVINTTTPQSSNNNNSTKASNSKAGLFQQGMKQQRNNDRDGESLENQFALLSRDI